MANELESVALQFESPGLSGAEATVVDLEAVEALDAPYDAHLEITIADPSADPLQLLGKDCVVKITRTPLERRLCGIVRTVVTQDGTPGAAHREGMIGAKVHVVPALFMLSLLRNTRMFQDQTAPEILEAVLGEDLGPYGRSVKLELDAAYPKREYCLQYQESDLDFVHRLMEEEGISYGFDHAGEKEVMVLRDANASYQEVETQLSPIELHATTLHANDREVLHAFLRRHDHTSTSVALREWDWTNAGAMIEETESGADAKGRDRESYEHGIGRSLTLYDFASKYQKHDAAAQKAVRHQAHKEPALVARGVGRVIGFTPGTTFELMGHPAAGFDGEYLLTRVVHTSRPAEERLGRAAERTAERYHNVFECIPLTVPHRPRRRTQKPRVPSIQTAIVTGPSGEEIHTDEHGRIKVQFHWDRVNPADEKSSCWVRCEQAWAGTGWGFWWLPRVGMEVVVHFVDGDPDRPMVTGCVYNGTNPTPYTLPDEKTKSTIKSSSSPGGGGSNELRFEDKAGSEEIYAHAQKDYNEVVLNDHTTTVHHDQTNEVDNDQTQTIGVNQTETVHGNQVMTVGGDRKVHVKGNFDETVDGTETRHTVGAVTESFGATETRSVGANLTETISGSETRTISGNKTETVTGSHTQTVSGASARTIVGSLTQTIVGGITESTPAAYNITAIAGMTVTTIGATNWTAPGGITLIAPGGITWVDVDDNWWGKMYLGLDTTAYDNFGVKMEWTGLAVSGVGVKCEQAAIEIFNAGMESKKYGCRVVAETIAAGAAGLGKYVAGLLARGC